MYFFATGIERKSRSFAGKKDGGGDRAVLFDHKKQSEELERIARPGGVAMIRMLNT
jgi:hypothetical protein